MLLTVGVYGEHDEERERHHNQKHQADAADEADLDFSPVGTLLNYVQPVRNRLQSR